MESLREKIEFPRVRFRSAHPLIQQVVSVTATLKGGDDDATFRAAQSTILKWLQARVGHLPEEAWEMNSFEHMTPGRFAAGIRINVPDGEYWAVRCDDPDKGIAGRTWTTEAALGKQGGIATFGLRLVVATTEERPAFTPSVPGIVRSLSSAPGLYRNGRAITPTPLTVSSGDTLDRLVNLLVDPRRRNPVFVISLDADKQSKPVIDPYYLASRCIGIAHVAVLREKESFDLSDTIGRHLSVFKGAVRTYRPNMTIDDDNFRHPLARASQIEEWNGIGSDHFVNMLIETAASNSVRAVDDTNDLPTFTRAKQVALRLQRSETGSDYPALLDLADKELEEKQREISGLESIVEDEERRRLKAEERVEELEGTTLFLRSRIITLETERLSGKLPEISDVYPKDYDNISEWCEEKLGGRLVLLPRAQREAKGAAFQDISLVYKVLEYLAGPFWRMKTQGGRELLELNEKVLADLGLRNDYSGAEHLLKEQGDTFEVQWGTLGRKHLLNMHVKNNGNTRDPARCLRVYYFWDDETQAVIVGSLPGHLNTRAT